ncbi:DUF2207 domain-containing protein [Candidatus Saccharibacteria bacterium]|nr:DUF2207 domain-containing protein [Candidatus Saccharibacteria bacterium]
MKKMTVHIVLFAVSIIVLAGFSQTVSAADTNNFTINSFQIDYYLNRDSEGRSTLKTIEKIEAEFPNFDQNHGIERAVPKSYDGHSTGLEVASVTDGQGKSVNYTTYQSNDNEVIRIGKSDQYVQGIQKYEITYNQRDVTRYFADTQSDEFYWDTNGTQWAVPIKRLNAALHFEGDVATKLNGNQKCYFGVAGANEPCSIAVSSDGFTVEASNLNPYENVTMAVGFQAKTFSAYQATLLDKLFVGWVILQFITTFVGFILTMVFTYRYIRESNRRSELGTVIPEYLPPKDASVTVSASIYNKQTTAFSAQLIDFAVRHYVKIYQTRDKSFFKPAQYELEIIKDISDLRSEEQEIIRDIFPATAVGTRLAMKDMKKNATKMYLNFSDNQKKLDTNIRGAYGLRSKGDNQRSWFKRAAAIALVMSIVTLSPMLFVASIIGFVCAFILWPLTDKGLALFRYLEGLKMYINTAEVERLRMLQSPEGAAKLDALIDTNDTRQLVKLYERVLPYAILFGQEKEWNKQLGQYYESLNASPDWYAGNSAVFNAVLFSSAINNFNSATTYSNPASSSSGGSGGGGFSGGGGGGGGGGGW